MADARWGIRGLYAVNTCVGGVPKHARYAADAAARKASRLIWYCKTLGV
jgi:hypothetical protein